MWRWISPFQKFYLRRTKINPVGLVIQVLLQHYTDVDSMLPLLCWKVSCTVKFHY